MGLVVAVSVGCGRAVVWQKTEALMKAAVGHLVGDSEASASGKVVYSRRKAFHRTFHSRLAGRTSEMTSHVGFAFVTVGEGPTRLVAESRRDLSRSSKRALVVTRAKEDHVSTQCADI